MNPPKKIIDLYNNVNFGIFEVNDSDFALPDYLGSVEYVDEEYFYNHSGDKKVSAWVRKIYEAHESQEEIDEEITNLFKYIVRRFSEKWNRLIKAFVDAEYNPINNYDMIEKENVGSKITNTSGQDVSTYGFNSPQPTPTGKSSSSVTTEGKKADNERELTRSGNIGVTTSAQMIEGELNLRKYDLLNNIYLDIDSVLARSLY